jgi:thiol-disulfide isomerase/thioredoxin
VEYDTPTDPAAVDACKIETVYNAEKKAIGYALRDGQGKMLRRFVDADAKGGMDQWSYYQDGFEVYREADLDGDRSPDEARWLNSAGTRVATLARGKVTGWTRISAEEASKVLVQGLVTPDLGLIETVMATPKELTALGVPKAEVDRVAAAASKRLESVRALMEGLVGWNKKTVWNRLDGLMPHLIPGDATTGLPHDLILYENAVIFAGPPGGQAPAGKLAFLQVPEMVKLGETWKFVELPRPIDPEKPVVASEGGIRASVFRQASGPQGESPEVEAALKALAQYDNANARAQAGGGREELAQFHHRRIPLLRAVVEATKNPDEQLNYNRQIVDSLAAAYQTGHYPGGLKILDGLARQGGKLGAYASFRKISAEFAARNDEPGANLMASQKAWMADLKGFLDQFPKSDEAAEALIQLASVCEFNAEEDEARSYYQRLARDFPETDAGKKAAGALRRLDLVGKPFELSGPGLGGQKVDTARYRGKALLVVFWASWASRSDIVRKDLPELVKLYQQNRGKGFEVVGVDLDGDKADLDAFLKETPLPWPQVFEPGGIEKNRFATEFGIISLPTMVLVDPQGKVVNRSLRTSAEVERQLEKVLPGKQAGVALDRQE